MTSDGRKKGGFGIYIHWPFCQALCPYCDFNSYVTDHIDQKRWTNAYLSEIERVSCETKNRILDSVFFGGGTPSLMSPETVAAILEKIRATWPVRNDFEVTLEANPTSVEMAKFRGFHDAGVNRVSLGIQALNDADLRRLGRLHSVKDAFGAFDIAQKCFDRISFDLIYARQYQTIESWRAELSQALHMKAGHISLYQLTIEEKTPFGARYRKGKLPGLPGEDTAADMYDVTQDLCTAAGLYGYEISNHAYQGQEARHNLIYWRGGDYAGIGPGAHGRLTIGDNRIATETILSPMKWLQHIETKGHGEIHRECLTLDIQAQEYIMMSLRLWEGCDMDRYKTLSGQDLDPIKLSFLTGLDLIVVENNHIKATPSGRRILNTILKELLSV